MSYQRGWVRIERWKALRDIGGRGIWRFAGGGGVSGEGSEEGPVLGTAERWSGVVGCEVEDWTESGEQEEGLRGALEAGTKMEVREGG